MVWGHHGIVLGRMGAQCQPVGWGRLWGLRLEAGTVIRARDEAGRPHLASQV